MGRWRGRGVLGRWRRVLAVVSVVGLVLVVGVPVAVAALDGGGATGVPPVAHLSAVPSSGVAPLAVSFDGSMSSAPQGKIDRWDLSFGDGTAAATGAGDPPADIAHTYAKAGIFTATLKIVVSTGGTDTSTFTVMVNSPVPQVPESVLGVDPASGGAPLSGSFDGSGSSDPGATISSWDLSFGDGTSDASGTGSPPAGIDHIYAATGSFSATLSVTDTKGQKATGTAQVTVTAAPPSAVLSASPGSGRPPL